MRKQLSFAGLLRLLALIVIILLILVVVKQFDALTTNVAGAFIIVGVLLIILDFQPLLVENVPSIYELTIVANGVQEVHEVNRDDVDKTIWMLRQTKMRFEIIGFQRIEGR